MTGRLDGKVCLVTGAARGIGAEIARVFHEQGARLALLDVEPLSDAAPGGIPIDHPDVVVARADVSDAAAMREIVQRTLAAFGRIDVLVNNAGINVFRDPLTMTEEDWRRCLSIDLEGAWNCCRAVLPAMIAAGGGSIVNLASVHSFNIIPGCFPYPVAKHAVIGLTRALGIEYAGAGIRVNAIAPGYIETQLNIDYWNSFDDPEAARRKSYDLHPPKRIGQPREVAMTALFLASDEAPFINASTITIDGGRSVLYHE